MFFRERAETRSIKFTTSYKVANRGHLPSLSPRCRQIERKQAQGTGRISDRRTMRTSIIATFVVAILCAHNSQQLYPVVYQTCKPFLLALVPTRISFLACARSNLHFLCRFISLLSIPRVASSDPRPACRRWFLVGILEPIDTIRRGRRVQTASTHLRFEHTILIRGYRI